MTDRRPAATVPDRSVQRAWWALALFVPSTLAAFVTGEALLAALGHGDGESVPAGVALAAGLPAMVVFALPVLLVRRLGRRAQAQAHPEGGTPVLVAATIVAVFVAANVLQLLTALLL